MEDHLMKKSMFRLFLVSLLLAALCLPCVAPAEEAADPHKTLATIKTHDEGTVT